MTLKESVQEFINNTNLTLIKWVSIDGLKKEQITRDEMRSILYNFMKKHLSRHDFTHVDLSRLKKVINYTSQQIGPHVIVDSVFFGFIEEYFVDQKVRDLQVAFKEIDYFQVYTLPKYIELTRDSIFKPEFNPHINVDFSSITNIKF